MMSVCVMLELIMWGRGHEACLGSNFFFIFMRLPVFFLYAMCSMFSLWINVNAMLVLMLKPEMNTRETLGKT